MPADGPTRQVPAGYIPIGLRSVRGQLLVRWRATTGIDLSFGFFRDSLNAAPEDRQTTVLTPLEALLEDPIVGACRGLIFHCARTGSTLLCQMLKCHPAFMVVGEPAILGQALRWPEVPAHLRLRALAGIFNAYGRWAREQDQALVIKTSSAAVSRYELLAEAAPTAARLLLYRDPIAVIESLVRKSPSWLKRCGGPAAPPVDLAQAAYMQFARDACEHSDPGSAFLDYTRLEACRSAVLDHFEAQPDAASLARMKNAMRLDAKKGSHLEYVPVQPGSLDAIRHATREHRHALEAAYRTLSEAPRQLRRLLAESTR